MNYNDDDYGEPCEHVKALRQYLQVNGLEVWAEHAEPDGWVNTHCDACHTTYEGLLHTVDEDDEE